MFIFSSGVSATTSMTTVTFIWATTMFILNCGVLAFYTSDIESIYDAQLQKSNVNTDSTDLDFTLPDKFSPFKINNHGNELTTDDDDEADNSETRVNSNLLKRSWRVPFFLRSFKPRPRPDPSVNRRRSQTLSVSGPLSSLVSMLAAEGRRRQQSESINNRMRLLELGKRDTTSVRDSTRLKDLKNVKPDLSDTEYDLKHVSYNNYR